MIDMRGWKSEMVDVLKGLHLDPENVRLDLESNAPEADIMLDLFKNEKALALVEGIVRVGYLTHEMPIVLRRKGKLVVVEGNRRVAALKAIQNPYLVPEFQGRISALTKTFAGRDSLRTIEVKYAPSQADADQLIAALHTGNTRVPWTPARQAAFFQAQIDAGRTLAQLRTNYPMIDVEKYVLRSAILQRFKAVAYVAPELGDFLRARVFPTSTLARIYESREFIELAGLKLDEAGQFSSTLSDRVFDAVAATIVQGMLDGDITTRSVNRVTSPRFVALMTELRDIAVGQPRGSRKSAGKRSSKKPGANPSKSTNQKTPFLDLAQFVVPDAFPPAIHRIFGELTTLNVDKHPNAAFDLLRTMLEKTIKSFADIKKEDIKKSGTSQGGYIYLSNCLSWLETWFTANGPKAQVQVVKKVRSTSIGDFVGSADHLNAINHNHLVFASADDVRTAWDGMRSMILEMFK